MLMKYDVVIAGAGPAGIGAAAAVMHETKTATDTVSVDLIRRHLIDRGVKLEDLG